MYIFHVDYTILDVTAFNAKIPSTLKTLILFPVPLVVERGLRISANASITGEGGSSP
jgi:hypothetical protein